MKRRAVLSVIPVALVAALGLVAQPVAAAPTAPNHMAAVGDSITRAFNVNSSYFLRDAPAESWSTGTDTKVMSEFVRLKAANANLVAENDAVTGAKMATLKDQMKKALLNGSDYITVLMGANDVCTSTVGTMTDPAQFKADFATAMAQIKDPALTGGKSVQVFVASIPNVNTLYTVYKDSSSARFTWSLYKTCQTVLPPGGNDTTRSAVATRLLDDNRALQDVCAQYSTCTWDGYAVNGVAFLKSDISTVDYFHPSVAGQTKLASVAWTASQYGH